MGYDWSWVEHLSMQLEKCEFTREPVKGYPRELKSILSCNSQWVAAKLVPQLNRWWTSFCLAPRNSTRQPEKKRGGGRPEKYWNSELILPNDSSKTINMNQRPLSWQSECSMVPKYKNNALESWDGKRFGRTGGLPCYLMQFNLTCSITFERCWTILFSNTCASM